MSRNDHSNPDWIEQAPPPHSYRSLFKWGDPHGFKHPNSGLVSLIKETFGLSDVDFVRPRQTGMEEFDVEMSSSLESRHLAVFTNLLGAENVQTGTYERVRASYGGGMIDALRLRQHIVENLPGAVLSPRSTEDVQTVMQYCDAEGIPLYVYGAGSTVTRGMEAVQGGVTLDMSRHMNQVVAFNEVDQTITVQAGMPGPELERLLNNASENFNAQRAYTCGHFPQSFMHSSVGGWMVTRGAGQNSTYYGKIEDIVLAQEYVTPRGILRTPSYPRCATGP
ncbi:MAG TPA: FAD-binding oxidoreductase, partial [Anaerolineaceae bacterium]|nr:FAD-binding oxidoreductase [Anaerolineaceae bacterium]